MNPVLKEYLDHIRAHPIFPELLKAVEKPKISPFRSSEADQSEKARAKWIFESGKKHQHDQWVAFLSGKTSEEGD